MTQLSGDFSFVAHMGFNSKVMYGQCGITWNQMRVLHMHKEGPRKLNMRFDNEF